MSLTKKADLHIHTLYSDGTFSPEEVVQRASRLKLACIAITDHDAIAGIGRAQEAAKVFGIEVLSGVELTAVFKEREIHVLGYGFRLKDPTLTAFLERMRRYRVDRIQAMIDRLRSQEIHLELETVQSIAGEGSLGRPHLAEAMVKQGFVRSMEEAFQRYLGDRGPCFVKGATLTVSEAVRLIRGAGGVVILAHPHRLIEEASIPELVAAGIQGIEVYHSDHEPSVVKKYRKIAEQHRLLITGGSDCHGHRKSEGPVLGTVTVPYEEVERLKAATNSLCD